MCFFFFSFVLAKKGNRLGSSKDPIYSYNVTYSLYNVKFSMLKTKTHIAVPLGRTI